MIERRQYSIRNDINNLVRDDKGKVSGAKLGTYAGQIIAGHLLMAYSHAVIERWDSMAILFLVLIAPEAYKRLLEMRWGGTNQAPGTTMTEESSRTTSRITKGAK